jgi:aromatase
MPQPTLREVEHEITVSAPAGTVHRLLADVDHWPRIYPRIVHAEQVPQGGGDELVLIWAADDDTFEHWTSQRTLHPECLRIDFRPTGFRAPLASMAGGWVVEPLADGASRLRLLHAFAVVDDDAEALARIDAAVDGNSRRELAELKGNIERAHADAEVTFSVEDRLRINGSAQDAYDFLREADRWGERLPHVSEARIAEDRPGLQRLELVTRAADGSTRQARFHRVCLPHRTIAFRQAAPPAPLSLHAGRWTFEEDDAGVTVSVRHTVVLDTGAVAGSLGPDATVADARKRVRAALSAESRATLGRAEEYAGRGLPGR